MVNNEVFAESRGISVLALQTAAVVYCMHAAACDSVHL